MLFRQKKGKREPIPETEVREDRRDVVGSNATLSNVAPERPPLYDPEELDAFTGTSSMGGLRGKPERGSKEMNGL